MMPIASTASRVPTALRGWGWRQSKVKLTMLLELAALNPDGARHPRQPTGTPFRADVI
jgi:hypothetical protein